MDASVDAYPATEVRAELNRILSSSNFVTSDRNRRFLEHVIEETLAGRGDRLKAYNIATIVFGRPANFDAQLDPVVRMEAGRVRRALERFYLIEGQPGVLRISIPKGGYQPQFSSPATMAVERTGLELAKTRAVFVSQFEAGGTAAPHNLNVGFTRQFMVRLHQLGHEVVAEPQIDPRGPETCPAPAWRIQRGSSWASHTYKAARATRRVAMPPYDSSDQAGFRCAYDPR